MHWEWGEYNITLPVHPEQLKKRSEARKVETGESRERGEARRSRAAAKRKLKAGTSAADEDVKQLQAEIVERKKRKTADDAAQPRTKRRRLRSDQ